MKPRTLLASAALIAALAAQDAAAQTTSTANTKRAPSPPMVGARSKAGLRRTAKHRLPPAPPPPVYSRSASRSTSTAVSPYGAMVGDPTGRVDKVGRPVGFYPSVRGMGAAPPHQGSALRSTGSPAPRENAARDPYKRPE